MTELLTRACSIAIGASPSTIWHALTDSESARAYYFGMSVESDWQAGSPIHYRAAGIRPAGDDLVLSGEVIAAIPNRMLVHSFVEATADGPAPINWLTWYIDPIQPGFSRVSLRYEECEPARTSDPADVCQLLLGNLKSHLESSRQQKPRSTRWP